MKCPRPHPQDKAALCPTYAHTIHHIRMYNIHTMVHPLPMGHTYLHTSDLGWPWSLNSWGAFVGTHRSKKESTLPQWFPAKNATTTENRSRRGNQHPCAYLFEKLYPTVDVEKLKCPEFFPKKKKNSRRSRDNIGAKVKVGNRSTVAGS